MSKFVLILVAAIVSVVVASPASLVHDAPENDSGEYDNEASNKNANDELEAVINGKIGFDDAIDDQFSHENVHDIIENENNVKNHNGSAENNDFPSKPEEQPALWDDCSDSGDDLHSDRDEECPPTLEPKIGGNHFTDCKPSKQYERSADMKKWCIENCLHTPSFCPASHCDCW